MDPTESADQRSKHKNAHCMWLCNVKQYHVCSAMSAIYSMHRYIYSTINVAKKLICQCGTISDEPGVLLDLWLTIHVYTFQIEKKPSLSHLSIKSLPVSEEGGSDQQMTPELFEWSIFNKM